MNELSTNSVRKNTLDVHKPQYSHKQSDIDAFANSLQKFEEKNEKQLDGESLIHGQSVHANHPLTDKVTQVLFEDSLAVESKTGNGLNSTISETQVTEHKEMLSGFDELGANEDSPLETNVFEATLDASSVQWSPPNGLESAEAMINNPSSLTLDDFTTLLEQGWTPKSPNNDQMWRFALQNTVSPVAEIVLKSDASQSGAWSVSLTVNENDKTMLNQHLDQLRERLDKLGNNFDVVELSEENA